MASRSDRKSQNEQPSRDDDMVRSRADEAEDMTKDTEEFEDTEDLDDEEEEEGEGSF